MNQSSRSDWVIRALRERGYGRGRGENGMVFGAQTGEIGFVEGHDSLGANFAGRMHSQRIMDYAARQAGRRHGVQHRAVISRVEFDDANAIVFDMPK